MLKDLSTIVLQKELEKANTEGCEAKVKYIEYILKSRENQCEIPSAPKESQIEVILSEIDFEKIHKTMVLLDWMWGTPHGFERPTISQLVMKGHGLLNDIWDAPDNEPYVEYSSGGFKAVRLIYDTVKILRLDFVLTGVSLDYEDVANDDLVTE